MNTGIFGKLKKNAFMHLHHTILRTGIGHRFSLTQTQFGTQGQKAKK